MSYCVPGVKATVYYKFGTGEYKIYKTEKTPIDIDANEKYTPPFASGQCPINYWVEGSIVYRTRTPYNQSITYFCTNNVSGGRPTYGKIIDIYHSFDIEDFCGTKGGEIGFNVLYFDYRLQQNNTTHINPRSRIPLTDSAPNNTALILQSWQVTSIYPANPQTDNCGDPQPVCTIKILHNNEVIFTDKGECPITFNVVCGEECPPGTTKCCRSDYPGYCCLPCDSTKSDLIGISSIVQSVNKGSVSYG